MWLYRIQYALGMGRSNDAPVHHGIYFDDIAEFYLLPKVNDTQIM